MSNKIQKKQGTFLFVGDSLIADFDWQKRMSLYDVHSFGFPGETVEGLLERLPTIEEKVEKAEIILVMIGVNNIIGQDYTFIDMIRKIIIRLRKKYPSAEIIINSLPPIKVQLLVEDAVTFLNNNIETVTTQTGCCFLSNFSKLEEKGFDIFQSDGVHLTPTTYDNWSRSILEYVAFLLEDD